LSALKNGRPWSAGRATRVASLVLLSLLAPLVWGAAARPPAGAQSQLTLHSRVFRNTRQLRVLTPPGYGAPANRQTRYPVFYFLDGIAAFDAWGVPPVAAELWSRNEIPPLLFVGIDNGGSTRESRNPVSDRASEYLPYPDPSWTTADAPLPRAALLPAFLFDEVMPLINARYRTRTEAAATGLAGDSFAGTATVYLGLNHPDRIGFLLVESPALHIGNGRLLKEATAATRWPRRVFLGVGTREGDIPEYQEEMLTNVRKLYSALAGREPGLQVHLEVTPGGAHGYDAWRKRLPGALRWLLKP
jgi:enterochelin esterase-like enzyme